MKQLFLLLAIILLITPTEAMAKAFAYVTDFGNDQVFVIDTESNTVFGDPIAVGGGPLASAISPDGTRVYILNNTDSTISTIDTTTNEVTGSAVDISAGITSPVFAALRINPDGSRLYAIDISNAKLVFMDTDDESVGSPIDLSDQPIEMIFSPDGALLYIADAKQNEITVISTANNSVIHNVAFPGVNPDPIGLALSSDGKTLYVTDTANDVVQIMDTENLIFSGSGINVSADPISIAIDSNDAFLYVVHDDATGTVSVIDLSDNSVTKPTTVGQFFTEIVLSFEQAPNGLFYFANPFASSDGQGGVDIFDPNDMAAGPQHLALGDDIFTNGMFIGPDLHPTSTPDISSVDFGALEAGDLASETIFIENTATVLGVDLEIGALALTGDTDFFKIFADNCSNKTLGPQESCDVTVDADVPLDDTATLSTVKLQSNGSIAATLQVPSNDANSPLEIPFQATVPTSASNGGTGGCSLIR